jgi:hypothetical protein
MIAFLFVVFDAGRVSVGLSGDRSMTTTASWISKKPDRCGGDA